MAKNHYSTLNLDEKQQPTDSQIKAAFRLALLTHHPDKIVKTTSPTASTCSPSIDAIKAAYAVLSNPRFRAEYDKQLLLSRKSQAIAEQQDTSFHTGEELADLDDLEYDDEMGIWYRGCRCGETRGYVVTEADLENEVQKGGVEVVVGCAGCSLWIRVGFGIVDEDENSNEDNKFSKGLDVAP